MRGGTFQNEKNCSGITFGPKMMILQRVRRQKPYLTRTQHLCKSALWMYSLALKCLGWLSWEQQCYCEKNSAVDCLVQFAQKSSGGCSGGGHGRRAGNGGPQ